MAGHARDPFTQQQAPSPKATQSQSFSSGGGGSSSHSTTSSTSTTSSSGGSSSGGGASSTTAAPNGTPAPSLPSIPASHAPPAPKGLSANQSYAVALAITNASGGLDTIDPLERLSPLPSAQNPLVVELGVLKGGRRVLFAALPGTSGSGPGSCTPGPTDCEILALSQNQIESISGNNTSASFAVTAIRAENHHSVADADRARRQESATGRNLLKEADLQTLALFPYEASLGVIVDLRNLNEGGG